MEQDKLNFIRENLDRPIVFVGLMGAGKTTLGEAFAEALGLKFIDTDDIIVEREGRSISAIFAESGEDYFRGVERDVIQELLQSGEPMVLGTGGGAFMNDATHDVIQENALSIFLDSDLDVLLNRVEDGAGRPLLEGQSPEEIKNTMQGLMDKRNPRYKTAHLSIKTKDEPVEEMLDRVQQAIYTHLTAG